MGAPRSRAWEAWAWRSQCGDTFNSTPARGAAFLTMRQMAESVSGRPFLREGNTVSSGFPAPRSFCNCFHEEQQKHAVAFVGLQTQQPVQIGFGQNALGQAIADGREPERAADIEGEIADAVAEGEERFHRGETPVAAGRFPAGERVGEGLQVGERHERKRLPCPRAKTFGVGAVGALGMGRAAVEPQFD
jgi:hypothetical protein